MDNFDEGLRCQDVHSGVRNVDPNSPVLQPLVDTRIVGMAATVAGLIRGNDVIKDAQALMSIAASQLDVDMLAFNEVVTLLDDAGFVSGIQRSGGKIQTFTLIKVTEHVRGAFLSDPDRGLQEYLYGGATGLKEKKQVAQLLQSLRPDGAKERDHLPDYYPTLRELVTRLMRRPGHMQNALRQAEAASAFAAARRQRMTLSNAFGDEFDEIAAKLVADVCGFLVTAAGIDPEFRVLARAYLLGESVPEVADRTGQPVQRSLTAYDH